MKKIAELLREVVPADKVLEKADMRKFVSFRAGGCAEILVEPEDFDQLEKILEILNREKIEFFVMGNGSNLLIRDGGYPGVIIRMAGAGFKQIEILSDGIQSNEIQSDGIQLDEIQSDGLQSNGMQSDIVQSEGILVKAGGGVLIGAFAGFLAKNSLTGFEFAAGIPGTIGGAVFMNAGAYGGEIKDVLVSAKLLARDGKKVFVLTGDELELRYRHSLLQDTGDIVLEAMFRFDKGRAEEIQAKMRENNLSRKEKQPLNYPNGGSTFKRPEGLIAAKLIQDAGLKGYHVGDAEVSTLHSGFVVNKGSASARDILKVMNHCIDEVSKKFGVTLEPEIRILGED